MLVVKKRTEIDFNVELVGSVSKGDMGVRLYRCDPEEKGWEDRCPLFNIFEDFWGSGLVLPERMQGMYAPDTNITQHGYSRKHQMGYFNCFEVYSDNEYGEKFARMVRIGGGEILPVYMYEHSGRAFSSIPFGDRWDSGCVGYAYMTGETIHNDAGALLVDGTTNRDKAKAWLKRLVRILNAWENRESYVITSERTDIEVEQYYVENILNLDANFGEFKNTLKRELLAEGKRLGDAAADACASLVPLIEYGYELEVA